MSSTVSSGAILAYEVAIARLIVVTAIEATPAVGRPPSRGFVAAALAGSVRRDIIDADAHRLSTFGILARQGLDEIHEWIDGLVRGGFLEVVRGRRGLIATASGRALAEGADPSRPLALVTGAVDVRELDLAVRSGLVEALRRYRAEQASALEQPEYRLFAESTLRELAARQPSNEIQLEAVPGLGAKRLAAYGIDLLRIVSEHAPIIGRLRRHEGHPGDVMDEPLVTSGS